MNYFAFVFIPENDIRYFPMKTYIEIQKFQDSFWSGRHNFVMDSFPSLLDGHNTYLFRFVMVDGLTPMPWLFWIATSLAWALLSSSGTGQVFKPVASQGINRQTDRLLQQWICENQNKLWVEQYRY